MSRVRIVVLGAALFACAAGAAKFPSPYTEAKVAPGLTSPTALAIAPDGRVFVALQDGAIRIIRNDSLLERPFASVPADIYGERGLLGIALDTGFTSNGRVYLYYTTAIPVLHNRVSSLTASGDTALPEETILLEFPELTDPWQYSHTGGGLVVGTDGKLYIGSGDQELWDIASDLRSPFGKILRLDPDGSIPVDNPWADSVEGPARAVWAAGFRNPFKLGVDRATGRIYAGDVGWSTREEVNLVQRGRHFGWARQEGPSPDSLTPYAQPLFSYTHGYDCAVMGGDAYRPKDPKLPAAYVGKYFFADFCSGSVRALDLETGAVEVVGTEISYPIDLAFNRLGDLYYISRGYPTGNTIAGASAVWKVAFGDSTNSGTGVRSAVRRSSAANGAVFVGGLSRLIVPPGMTGVTVLDLTGRAVWEIRGIHPGEAVPLPAHVRGALRARWIEKSRTPEAR
jgi:glucose/arabinose dehydrogenase